MGSECLAIGCGSESGREGRNVGCPGSECFVGAVLESWVGAGSGCLGRNDSDPNDQIATRSRFGPYFGLLSLDSARS